MRFINNNIEFGPKSPSKSSPSNSPSSMNSQRSAKSFNNVHHPEKTVKYALLVISLVYIVIVYTVYNNFPKLSDEERLKVKIPKNEEEVRNLASILVKYRDNNYLVLFCAILSLYILLQSCAIPGSIMLSLLAGYLFPLPVALFLICLCSAIGASICYCISFCFGRELVLKYFPERAADYRAKVAKNRPFLLSYILFLRITPIIPNWVINLVSPLIDVPLSTFFWATFFGVAPPSFLHIQTVKTLEKIVSSDSSHFSYTNVAVLIICASLALSPVIYRKVYR